MILPIAFDVHTFHFPLYVRIKHFKYSFCRWSLLNAFMYFSCDTLHAMPVNSVLTVNRRLKLSITISNDEYRWRAILYSYMYKIGAVEVARCTHRMDAISNVGIGNTFTFLANCEGFVSEKNVYTKIQSSVAYRYKYLKSSEGTKSQKSIIRCHNCKSQIVDYFFYSSSSFSFWMLLCPKHRRKCHFSFLEYSIFYGLFRLNIDLFTSNFLLSFLFWLTKN